MRLLIRGAVEADATAIAQVHLAAWRSTYGGIVAQDHIERLSVDDFATRWRSRLGSLTGPATTVLVATDQTGDIVGFTSGGPSRESSLPFVAPAGLIVEDWQALEDRGCNALRLNTQGSSVRFHWR